MGVKLEVHPAQRQYTLREEAANALTHSIALGLAFIGFFPLVMRAASTGSFNTIVAVVIYGLSLIAVYASSTCHHSARRARPKQLFLLFDHCSIFLLMAGSSTPFALVSLPSGVGTAIFVISWFLSLIGIGFTLVSFLTPLVDRYDKALLVLYLSMGWFTLVWGGQDFLNALPADCVAWLLAGGLLYTGGAAFYHWKLVPYSHAVWHVFAMLGSAAHFYAVYTFVAPVAA